MENRNIIRITSSVIIPSPLDPKKFIYVLTKKDGKWGLPAGKLDPFEHPEEGAVRELMEEIGTTVVLDHLIGIYHFESQRRNSILNIVYSGRIEEKIPNAQIKEGIADVREFTLGEIRELYKRGRLRGLANLKPLENYIKGIRHPLGIIHPTIHDLQISGKT